MMKSGFSRRARGVGFALLGAALSIGLAGCEFGPKQITQTGFRGTGMAQIQDKDLVGYLTSQNAIPAPLTDVAATDGDRAGAFYENVQVLDDLSTDEFNRLMIHITEWVVPKDVRDRGEGCNYCHNPQNLASDEVYQKVVARKMLQMTRTINTGWTSHVKETGVTCWTCHRGQPVPAYVWSQGVQTEKVGFIGSQMGQNKPIPAVGWTTSPTDPFSPYLSAAEPVSIRVNGTQSLRPPVEGRSIRATETTLGLMQHMSVSLGVNCTFCHNTRAFASWQTSSPQRLTAWHGLRMIPALNKTYMDPLQSEFAKGEGRLGPAGDVLKVNCSTCHQGAAKPLLGVSMRADYPELWRGGAPVAPAQTQIKLPSGASLNVPAGSIGEQLFKFLSSNEATPRSFVFDNLFFNTGSAALTAESKATTDTIAEILKAFPNVVGTIDGYTDNRGRPAANLSLSKFRAQTVFDGLVAQGVTAGRLSHDGFGDAKPIGDNATDAGRAVNRRIELTVTKK
jgi:photosynthetic reaction center cytochrome c subunit